MPSRISIPLLCAQLTPFALLILIFILFSLEGCASRKEVMGLQYEINSLKRQVINLRKEIKSNNKIKAYEADDCGIVEFY